MDPPYSDPWEWEEDPDLPGPFDLELLFSDLNDTIDDGDPVEVLSDWLFEELGKIGLEVNFPYVLFSCRFHYAIVVTIFLTEY